MITFISSAVKKQDYPLTNKEVVFVGRSNVGKSSLINALYGKIAYVGKTPGKTRLLNFFNVDNKYSVCDVPGYGYAKRSDKEIIEFGKMMDDYFTFRDKLKLCVIILDIRRLPNEDDLGMIEYVNHNNISSIIVLNKIDKLSNNEINKQLKAIANLLNGDYPFILTSTLKKRNIAELRKMIEDKLDV